MTMPDENATPSASTVDAAIGKTADAARDGIDRANDAVDGAVTEAANKVDRVRNAVAPALKDGIDRAQSMVQQGSTFVSDTTLYARVRASELADQVVVYTQQKPVTALMLAAASGALMLSLVSMLTRRRR